MGGGVSPVDRDFVSDDIVAGPTAMDIEVDEHLTSTHQSSTRDSPGIMQSWAKDLPPHIQQSLSSRGANLQKPNTEKLEALWKEKSFRDLFNLGQRKTFIRICLAEDALWSTIPSQIQAKMFEVFMENGVVSAEDICELTVEELLSMNGLPPKVDELMAAGIISRAEAVTRGNNSSLPVIIPFHATPPVAVSQPEFITTAMSLAAATQNTLHTSDGNKSQFPNYSELEYKSVTISEVYTFMELCSDRQNGGLVDKIVIPPAQIKRFCDSTVERRLGPSAI